MEIKGSIFWYNLLLGISLYFGYKQFLLMDELNQVLLGTIFIVITIAWILGTFFSYGDSLQFGYECVYEGDDCIPYLFRFSLLHFIACIINMLIIIPIRKIALWCDKNLTIQIKKPGQP